MMFDTDRAKYADLYSQSDRKVSLIPLKRNVYIGGFFNYIVTKAGAKRILSWIKKNHIRHGIDYLMKIIPELNVYETQPHIVFTDWVRTTVSNTDSDIQKDFNVLNFDKVMANPNATSQIDLL